MKKLLALMSFVVLSAMISFAGTITYYNRTSETVRFLRDNAPVGPGDVMPGGFTQETVGYGSYLLSATDGRQYAPGYTCTIDASDDGCEYTVFSGSAFIGNNNPNLRTVNYTPVSQLQFPGFSVDFSSQPQVETFRNDANTSTRTVYTAIGNEAVEQVVVVKVDHDIPVDYTSSDFYRDADVNTGETLATNRNSQGLYQGHPYSYGCYTSTVNGVDVIRFSRFIIVNSRTAIFIVMAMPNSDNAPKTPTGAFQAWQDFENTLNIQ